MTCALNDELFDLPEFGYQEELISVMPELQRLNSKIKDPVAHLILELPLLQMSQIFDYEIPEKFADLVPGSRVVVQFGSSKVHGYVISRSANTHYRQLKPILKVISQVPVLTPDIYALLNAVSEQTATPLADGLRLAIPKRHARTEREFEKFSLPKFPNWTPEIDLTQWSEYENGKELIADIGTKNSHTHSTHLLPHADIAQMLSAPLRKILATNQSALVLVPQPAVAYELADKLAKLLPEEPQVVITAQDLPEVRYKKFLKVLYGHTRLVIGTRSAVWLPLQNLGLITIIDDAHAAFNELRSPYLHVRDICQKRQKISKTQILFLNKAPSIGAYTQVVASSGLIVSAPVSLRRTLVPQIFSANSVAYENAPWARMPDSVFSIIREGLTRGSVLLVVPNSGYIPMLACKDCNTLAKCPHCMGTLQIVAQNDPPKCGRCNSVFTHFQCAECTGQLLKAIRIGSHRTAQEIGRAFPKVNVQIANANKENSSLIQGAKIVVATPGMEPLAKDKYAAAVILDAGYLLNSASLETEMYFYRALGRVASKVRSRKDAGKVLIVGDVPNSIIEIIGRWEFSRWESAQYQERTEIGLPPVAYWYELNGDWEEIKAFLGLLKANMLSTNAQFVPLETLIDGGVHEVIPEISLLGPNFHTDNQATLYLHLINKETGVKVLNETMREALVKGIVKKMRVRFNPQL